MTPFDVYIIYLAISRHFTTKSYNYNKYNGKVSAKYDTFLKRRDKGLYHMLSKRLQSPAEVRDYFIANMVTDDDFFPAHITKEESFECYRHWKKRREKSNDFLFRDLKIMKKEAKTLKELLLSQGGATPLVIQLFIRGKISFETLAILQYTFKFLDRNQECEDPLFKRYDMRIRKYVSFVQADWVAVEHLIDVQLLRGVK